MNLMPSRAAVCMLSVVLMTAAAHNNAMAADTNSDEFVPTVTLEPHDTDLKNRFGLSYRMGLNISVDFRRFGGLGLSNPGPATGSTENRNYDNGYNRVDSSTNAGGLTWYWGYQSPQSVQGDELVLQSYSTPANASSNGREDNPQQGFEVSYQRELLRRDKWRMGVEGAFGYTFVSVTDNRMLHNYALRTNDAFQLNGTVPPLPPYSGTYEGAGDLIGSTPSRSTDFVGGAATIDGERKLEANVFMFRLGPYLEVPLNQRISLLANAGLALVVGQSDFSFTERVTISDPSYDVTVASGLRKGSGSQTDFLVGGYAGGGLAYSLTREVALFGGVEFQAAGRSFNKEKGKESILDLGQSILVSVGVTYSF